jgi:hypothetical protein
MLPVLTLALVLASAAASTCVAHAQSDLNTPGWRTFVDSAHGTAVEYPAALFSVDAGAPERGFGRAFETQDGRAKLVIYMLPNEERRSPEEYLRRHLVISPGVLDYRRVTGRFFAISGARHGTVFYSRCNFPRARRGDMQCIFLQYPERETKAWDRIVTKISLSLRSEPSAMALTGSRAR